MKLSHLMRPILVCAVFCGCAAAIRAATPVPLATLEAVHALTNAEAQKQLPVAFEATVTYYRNADTDLFVQDGDSAIYVDTRPGASLQVGDRVRITGSTRASFRPMVSADSVTLLHHGAPPRPAPASFEQLMRADLDCRRVTLRGQIRSADRTGSGELRSIFLQILTGGRYVDAVVSSGDAGAPKRLLDAEVEITGIAAANFDQRRQLTSARIDVGSLADVKILKPAATSPESLELTPMDQVLTYYRAHDSTPRVRVRGTITYYQPGATLVIQDGAQSLWIQTASSEPLRIGDVADVTGFPDAVRNGYLTLTHASVRDTGVRAPIQPTRAGGRDLGFGGNAFNLITTEGQVVKQVRTAAVDEYVLVADGHMFSALYCHPLPTVERELPPAKPIPAGSKVRVTGVGMFYTADPFDRPVAAAVLLRSPEDVAVVAGPSWLSTRNLTIVVGLLLGAVFATSLRGWFLERKVRRQAASMAVRKEAEAALERQRSCILEEINASRPLAEILELIAKMVSSQLEGAACWCEVADGSRLGGSPARTSDLRIVRREILGRGGAVLGVLTGALDPRTPPAVSEAETFSVGARLATLAFETHDLFSDLHYRSEFDQLTEAHNRFSLDRFLARCIAEADQKGGIFGLIYVDLDDFKQVNDVFGHGVGDLYLQEVTLRMKRQLRSHDMLARLGGDEFAALIPRVHSRAEVEEIAQRLERCFSEPFSVAGNLLCGSVSLGFAIYPKDGGDQESLFSAADAAMYMAKNAKRGEAAVSTPTGKTEPLNRA